MTCISIMQPTFNPWIGYFDLIDQADYYVVYDDIQLAKRNWQVRNKIKNAKNEVQYLTIPVKKNKSRDELLINEAEINNEEKWKKKHLKSYELNYKKAKNYREVMNFLNEFYEKEFRYLLDFTYGMIREISNKLGITTEFIISSSLNVKSDYVKDKRLTEICKKTQSNCYLSPLGSAEYIEEQKPGGELAENGIDVYYQNYSHPCYEQINGDFISHMGIIDLLFNKGFEKSLDIIKSGRRENIHFKEIQKYL